MSDTESPSSRSYVSCFKKFVKIINSRVTISASFPETYHFVPSFSRDEDLGPWERAREKKDLLALHKQRSEVLAPMG